MVIHEVRESDIDPGFLSDHLEMANELIKIILVKYKLVERSGRKYVYPNEVREWAEDWWSDDSVIKRLCAFFLVKFPLEAIIALAVYLILRSLVVAVGGFSIMPEIHLISTETIDVIGYGLILNLVFCNFIRNTST